MKLVEEQILLNQSGTVKIVPEELDDLWVLYNLIAPGDIIASDTTRKVSQATGSGTGKGSSRVKIRLEINITAVDYVKNSATMRVRGRNMNSNEHVASGAYHTLEIEKNKQFDLTKKVWDSAAIDALHEGCEKGSGSDLAVILMQQGWADIYLVGAKETNLCAKIEEPAAKRNAGNKFFENVFRAFVKHVDLNAIRCVLIGSPGSIKDEFRCYVLSEAKRQKMKSIEDNKSRMVLVSIRERTSLKELLYDNTVMNLIKDTKAVMEIRAFKEFSEMLSSASDRVCYGPKHVDAAHELTAIETLLITDDLFRNPDVATRKKYIALVKSIEKSGGKAFVFSSKHVSGDQLAQLSGIAAILRFPLPHLDDMIT